MSTDDQQVLGSQRVPEEKNPVQESPPVPEKTPWHSPEKSVETAGEIFALELNRPAVYR